MFVGRLMPDPPKENKYHVNLLWLRRVYIKNTHRILSL